jgi:peptidyl-prolyl cis-trans isomerase D
MLSFFRRGGGIAQVIIGSIVVLIIVVFVVEFRQGGRAQGRVNLECAVKVFDYCADSKEYDAVRALIEPPGADPKWVRQQRLDRYAIEGLVERELLVREAKRLGLSVGDQAVDDELGKGRARASLPVADARELSGRLGLCRLTDGRSGRCLPGADVGIRLLRVKSSKTERFDYKVYERTIRVTTNRGAKEFREMQQRELIAERLRQLVRGAVRVSEDLAYRLYQREHSRAAFRQAGGGLGGWQRVPGQCCLGAAKGTLRSGLSPGQRDFRGYPKRCHRAGAGSFQEEACRGGQSAG